MKKIIVFVFAIISMQVHAQQISTLTDASQITPTSIVYALPKTSIKIKVEVEKEIFTAGPYALYSQKYLNTKAEAQNRETYSIKSISMMPFIEIDANSVYVINYEKLKNANANFLQLTSQGFVFQGTYNGDMTPRFTVDDAQKNKFLDNKTAYADEKNVYINPANSNAETEKKSIQLPQLTGSVMQQAEEAASQINDLRQKRIDIVSGDSDFTGEGVKAALDEIKSLEEEYTSLFTGKSKKTTEIVYFDVIPDAKQTNQTYIAFRFSEKQGASAADNIGGRPIMLNFELEPSSFQSVNPADNVDAKKRVKAEVIYYKEPRATKAKLVDGTNVLLQDRFLIFQFGNLLSVPADLKIK